MLFLIAATNTSLQIQSLAYEERSGRVLIEEDVLSLYDYFKNHERQIWEWCFSADDRFLNIFDSWPSFKECCEWYNKNNISEYAVFCFIEMIKERAIPFCSKLPDPQKINVPYGRLEIIEPTLRRAPQNVKLINFYLQCYWKKFKEETQYKSSNATIPFLTKMLFWSGFLIFLNQETGLHDGVFNIARACHNSYIGEHLIRELYPTLPLNSNFKMTVMWYAQAERIYLEWEADEDYNTPRPIESFIDGSRIILRPLKDQNI